MQGEKLIGSGKNITDRKMLVRTLHKLNCHKRSLISIPHNISLYFFVAKIGNIFFSTSPLYAISKEISTKYIAERFRSESIE